MGYTNIYLIFSNLLSIYVGQKLLLPHKSFIQSLLIERDKIMSHHYKNRRYKKRKKLHLDNMLFSLYQKLYLLIEINCSIVCDTTFPVIGESYHQIQLPSSMRQHFQGYARVQVYISWLPFKYYPIYKKVVPGEYEFIHLKQKNYKIFRYDCKK